MTDAFDASELERRYAFLDDCPDQLLAEIVTLPVGSLAERVHGIRTWRESLLLGRLPPEGTWPPREIGAPARLAVLAIGVLPFFKGQPELVDAFLRDVLASFGRRLETFRAEVAAELRRLRQLELHRDEDRQRLRRRAQLRVAQRSAKNDDHIITAWGERARTWAAIAEVFGDLGEVMGRGWDMSTGVLKHIGWMDIVRLRALLEQLPQVRDIVQSLGRLHAADGDTSVAESVFVPVRRIEEERREVWTNRIPAETRGLERSGEIARMLPVEAINLGHSKLRYLWHARRAERALLTYRVEGIEVERAFVERESYEASEARHPPLQRGPIVAIIDTSGSMHGLPERVAKALVLEALRIAHAEKRGCLVYAYGGPENIIEHELDLTPDGIGQLLTFLTMSFGGGSDERRVLKKVLRRLEDERWSKADVVFVSDGEWPAPSHLIPGVAGARARGTRFHGVQIGNRGRTGLHAICDPVHMFEDWAGAAGWR